MKKLMLSGLILSGVLGLSACNSTGSGSTSSQASNSVSSSSASSKGICQQTRGDTSGGGKNVLYRCNGHAVLNSAEAKSILNGTSISFAGGGSVIANNLTSAQNARAIGKSDEDACIQAFLNTVNQFKGAVGKHGGSRVTDFHSYLDKNVIKGGAFECKVGTWHARVIMKGDVAR